MKKTTVRIIATFITFSSLLSTVSWADGPGDRQNQQQWQNQNGDRHNDRGGREAQGRGPGGDRHDGGPRGGDRNREHFAANGHDFRRGHRVPDEFRGPRYRVDDWRARRLPEPPRGQYWSNIDGNYVLVAAATGVITSLILSGALR